MTLWCSDLELAAPTYLLVRSLGHVFQNVSLFVVRVHHQSIQVWSEAADAAFCDVCSHKSNRC